MDWTLSVTQLNEYVRRQLAADPILRNLRVEGEISGFKRYASGHCYFALKDDNSRISCVMFRQNAQNLDFVPTDGMCVMIQGSASVYVQEGKYQLYVESMQKQGIGDLFLRFQMLKEKLANEGLFDASIKKPLPLLPQCIGIVTSRSGAVLHDILRVGWKRYPNMRFVLAPSAVQGQGAAEEIADALRLLDESGLCDVILCGRGGGSLEELWPFNEECVAKAIHSCNTPVVSCVGHETDFTIADFVADLRAATPSAAAELTVPEKQTLTDGIERMRHDMCTAVETKLTGAKRELELLTGSPVFRKAEDAYILPRKRELQELTERLQRIAEAKTGERKNTLEVLKARLTALAPDAPLRRGFALVETENGIITDSELLRIDTDATVRMRDGKVRVHVTGREGKMCQRSN